MQKSRRTLFKQCLKKLCNYSWRFLNVVKFAWVYFVLGHPVLIWSSDVSCSIEQFLWVRLNVIICQLLIILHNSNVLLYIIRFGFILLNNYYDITYLERIYDISCSSDRDATKQNRLERECYFEMTRVLTGLCSYAQLTIF